MTRSALLELIANGENSGVEFKRDDLRPEQLAKEVTALANLEGGHILIGVEDNGTISGIKRKDLEIWVMDTVFGRKLHPMIIPFYEEIQLDDGVRVAVVSITQAPTKPYVVRHNDREDIYVRIGSTSRLATREQQARLYSLGGMLHAEALPVPGTGLSDLSRGRIVDYLTSIVGHTDTDFAESELIQRLLGLGFMVESNAGRPVCTISGLILFAYRPRRYLRHAGVRWMAFEGTEKAYRALDDRVIDGPLIALWHGRMGRVRTIVEDGLVERLLLAMRPFVSEERGEIDESMRRVRDWHYPPNALREAILNAIAHRDWTRFEEIEIVRYADRLEITSPGALQNTMTVEKMLEGHRSARNPDIVAVLRDYGYVDARGMGVRNTIVPALAQQNGTQPTFIATEDFLQLVMKRGPDLA